MRKIIAKTSNLIGWSILVILLAVAGSARPHRPIRNTVANRSVFAGAVAAFDAVCDLAGSMQEATDRGVSLTLDASGGLPGTFSVELQYDAAGHVTGGDWKLEVSGPINEGAIPSNSSLSGRMSGGTLTFSETGAINSVAGGTMVITEGKGNYENFTGNGTLTLARDPEKPENLVGKLSLTF